MPLLPRDPCRSPVGRIRRIFTDAEGRTGRGWRPGGRRWLGGLAVALLALLTAGCELRAEVDVELEPDGAGRLAVTFAADEKLAARARAQDIDPLDELAAAGRTLAPTGWETDERETADGGRSVTLATRFDSLAEFEQLSAELAGALAAPELDPLDPFAAGVDGDRLRVSGRAGLEPTETVTELGLEPDEAVARLAGAVDYRVRIHMAGDVLETTAHDRRGGTLTWTVPPGGSVDIVAVARQPARPRRSIAAGGVALGIGCAVLAWWLARRRRPRVPEP